MDINVLIASWGDFGAVERTAARGVSAADSAVLADAGVDPTLLLVECQRRVAMAIVAEYDDGPAGAAEAASLFTRVFGRQPDADDGDPWSHVCAAAQV